MQRQLGLQSGRGQRHRGRRLRCERLELRELLSGQTPLIANAEPYTQAYINGVYRDALGRSADAGALAWFTQQIDDRGQPLAIVPSAVLRSTEYETNLVQSAYQQYLGRVVDRASLAFWLNALGTDTRDDQFLSSLVASDEFYGDAGGSDAAWISAAYQAVLGRPAQPTDVQWATALLASGASRGQIALDIVSSVEHEQQVVEAEYERYWHAPADANGLTYWATQIATGPATPESLAGTLMGGDSFYEQQTGMPQSIVPVPYKLPAWWSRVAQVTSDAKDSTGSVLFIGDSITQGWQSPTGEPVWDKYYAPLNALDAGVAGDKTQNVLWRIESGELDGLSPKVVVLMVGVNNIIAGDSPQEVTDGVAADIAALRQRLPDSKILLLGILPAIISPPGLSFMTPIAATNQLLAGLADGQNVVFLDLWPSFTNPDGTYRPDLHVADGVHLNTAGYTVYAQAIAPQLDQLLRAP